ncbi:MAG: WD40 repeat domain-containing protein [Deltaproteobacteria bacterium]|nr:WD40 repeat domain-containing protein [Deltaproteobacteria bacterium]
MSVNEELEALRRTLADDSRSDFIRQWWAVRRLTRLAARANGSLRDASEARALIEGLVAGLESVHWNLHQLCRASLERLREQALKEAVCDLIIERDLPRLRTLAVHGRYEPQDPLRRAAYLFVLGILQFYEAHDPEGAFLAQFYEGATPAVRERFLRLACSWGDQRLGRLIVGMLRRQGTAELSKAEGEAVIEVLGQPQFYEAHDPEGVLLAQFYKGATPAVRERLLRLASSWDDRRLGQLITSLLHHQGGRAGSDAELTTAVAMLNTAQRWEALWSLAMGCPVVWSWRGVQHLAAAGWQPQETRKERGWAEVTEIVQGEGDCPKVGSIVGQQRTVLDGHQGGVLSLALSVDGTMLASGGDDNTIILWELPRGRQQAVLQGHQDSVSSLALSADGTTLASGSKDRTLIVWDVPSEQPRAVLRGHQDWVLSLALSADGTTLASGSKDKTLIVWDGPSEQPRAVLRGHQGVVRSLALSADGTTLASASGGNTIILWELPRGQQRKVLQGHQDVVYSLVLSADGTTLASAGKDKTIIVWDLSRGRPQTVLSGHQDWVRSLALSADGITLASGSWDGGIILWDVPGERQGAVLGGHQGVVESLALSADGTTLASGSWGGSIILWDLWDMYQVVRTPLGQMGRRELARMERCAAAGSLSAEQRAVARYIAAVLRYRLGEE